MLEIMGNMGVKTTLTWRNCQFSQEEERNSINRYGVSLNYVVLMTRAADVEKGEVSVGWSSKVRCVKKSHLRPGLKNRGESR